MNPVQRMLLVLALLALPNVISTHHSYAAVDLNRRETIQGSLKAVEWRHPHVWLWVVTEDANGRLLTYAFKSSSPSELTRFLGWETRMLRVGDRITVGYAPFKNGNHGGALDMVT
jgi:Family of unknown function (DUF6152)